VVVHVRLRVVLLLLGVFGPIFVRMNKRRVVVLVLVVRRTMLELAVRTAHVVMGHVPVVVHVNLALVLVNVLLVADDFLPRRGMDGHVRLLMAKDVHCT